MGGLPQFPASVPQLGQDILQFVPVDIVQGEIGNPFAKFCLKSLKLRRSYASLPHLLQGACATGHPLAYINSSGKAINLIL